MANIKISELPAASAASTTQEFETNDSGTSKKVTGSQLKAFVKDGLVVADVTDLTASAAELNTLDGILVSTSELNSVYGITANVQSQLDAKAPILNPTFTGTVGLPAATVADSVTTTADNGGTFSSGTYTPTPVGGNMKRIVNGGAFTLAAPTVSGDYTLVIQITNNGTAGAVTLSGFNKTLGSSFTTTSGNDFFVYITKCNGFIFANTVALQ